MNCTLKQCKSGNHEHFELVVNVNHGMTAHTAGNTNKLTKMEPTGFSFLSFLKLFLYYF